MRKYFLLLTVVVVLLFCSYCDDIETTQKQPLAIEMSDSEVYADGQSYVIVTATSENKFPDGSKVSFTTTSGSLHLLDAANFNDLNSSIEVDAQGKVAEVVLLSPLLPEDNVLITAKVNTLISIEESLVFKRSFPDEILLSTDKDKLSLSQMETTLLQIALRSNTTIVSDQTRIKIIPDVDGIVDVQKNDLISGQTSVDIAVTPLSIGVVKLLIILDHFDGPHVAASIMIEVIE